MNQRTRSRVALGVILLLLGAWFLAVQFVPALKSWYDQERGWPLIVVAVGAFLLLLGLLTATPGMAVPACIVAGIGGILYWQNQTGQWESWAYLWTLIPGFVGVGVFLSGLLGERSGRPYARGSELILTSLILFLIFGAITGSLTGLSPYWPVLLIAAGLIFLVRALVHRR